MRLALCGMLLLSVVLFISQLIQPCFCGSGVIAQIGSSQLTTPRRSNERSQNSAVRPKTDKVKTHSWLTAFEGGFPPQRKTASDQELELTNYLLAEQGYNPLIRPVANISDAIRVDLGLCMIQLINLDERRQVMKSNVWLPMVWSDYKLKWDPAEFGGLRVIRLPHNRLWKPDMVLFNNADGNYEVVWRPNLLLHNDGSILWMPPAVYESSCAIDVEYFPFDEQECEMKFGSWAFDATKVSVGLYSNLPFVDLSDYWKSGTWDLVDVPGKVVNTTSGGVQYTHIIYTIKLRRKTLFYTVNLLVPCVLISMLSICVFYLPSDAGEKVTLAISIVVALVIFLILVSKILPPTSKTVPLISRYLMFTFVLNILCVVMAVVVVNWNYRSPRTHGMSKWIKILFLNVLPKLLFMNKMKRPCPTVIDNTVDSESAYGVATNSGSDNTDAFIQKIPVGSSPSSTSSSPDDSTSPQCLTISNTNSLFTSNTYVESTTCAKCDHAYENIRNLRFSATASEQGDLYSISESSLSGHPSQIPTDVNRVHCSKQANFEIKTLDCSPRRIGLRSEKRRTSGGIFCASLAPGLSLDDGLASVDFIAAMVADEEEDRLAIQQWKYAASVIDRLMLIIFSVITVIVAFSILTNAPSLNSSIDQDEIINKFSVLKRK